jgi:hypothetical protein
MINFGRDFDQDPNLPWAAEILKKPRNPEGKMHLLFRMAFYPGYCLHGVYSASNGSNAWTPAEGERIRAGLNRRLGEELVQCGPFDLWARRHQSQRRGAGSRRPDSRGPPRRLPLSQDQSGVPVSRRRYSKFARRQIGCSLRGPKEQRRYMLGARSVAREEYAEAMRHGSSI